jgi:alpha-tubulin suppressor-like RCC1 family protein
MTWGEAGRGQIGSGRTVDRTVPAAVAGIPLIASIGCGRDHTLAVTRTGALWAWGMNDFGQLGDGTTTTRLAPVLIGGIDDAVEAHGGRGYTVVRRNTA